MGQAVAQANGVNDGVEAFFGDGLLGDVGWQSDVFSRGECGDEVEGLEDEPDLFAS